MATNEMYVDIEKIIEGNNELHELIINEGNVEFKSGDIVKCSYIQDKLFEVKFMMECDKIFKDKVSVSEYGSSKRTAIGKRFLKKVEVNKNTMKILFKS